MKTVILLGAAILIGAAIAFAEQRAPGPQTPAEPGPPATHEPRLDDEATPAGGTISGEVREVIDVTEYTYVRLATTSGDTWAAVRKAPLRAGQKISVADAQRMEAFTSTTLERTFDVIYFGELAGESASRDAAALPPGHPPLVDGAAHQFDHGEAKGAVGAASQQVARASGENGKTVADLYADRARLSGKRVRVRGQIVKATPGVLGKNYYRLRDGSSADPVKSDLVVTTQAEPKVDDIVTFEGTLRSDIDIGIGFVYPVLLEDATLRADP